jgi:hypothetical protein
VRIVITAVLADAADAVLVAHHLPKLGAHLVTAMVCLRCKISREQATLRRGPRGRKRAGRRARVYPERENAVVLSL